MKKDFLTGLALLMPFVLTLIIIIFLIKIVTAPLMGTVSSAFDYYDILNKPFLFLNGSQVLQLSSRLVILAGLFVVTIVFGILARLFLIKYFVRLSEYVIHRTPFVNNIYKSIQDVVKTVFSKSDNSFSEVVLVPFPHANARSIGLVTSRKTNNESDPEFQELVTVFVPGTPNPSMGFMLLFKREQLTSVDMTVKDAMKFLVSCGVIAPEKNNVE